MCIQPHRWAALPCTKKVKLETTSCHRPTTEYISIQSLPTRPHTPSGQPMSGVGQWDSHHVWYGCPHIAMQIDTVVLDFLIFPALRNGGAQGVDFGSANRQKLGVFAPQFLGDTIKTYIGDKIGLIISEHSSSCGKVSRKSAQARRKNLW